MEAGGSMSGSAAHSSDVSPLLPWQSRQKQCLDIARRTAHRLRRKFPWIPADDLYSYALFGIVRAASNYQPDRQVPFAVFASRKCLYVAMDEMRRDGFITRGDRPARPRIQSLEATLNSGSNQWTSLCDRSTDRTARRMETREWCAKMLSRLKRDDRRLLMLRYSNGLCFREIGAVLGISESTVCFRHKAILRRLRRMATALRPGAGLSTGGT